MIFIRPTAEGKDFSAGVYAEQRCNQIEGDIKKKKIVDLILCLSKILHTANCFFTIL